MDKINQIRINRSFPLYLLMFLLIFQGYLHQFGFTSLSFIRYRPLTWGVFLCFLLWVVILLRDGTNIPRNRFNLQGFKLMIFVYIAFLVTWTTLGIFNQNFAVVTDAKAFTQILLITIISFSCFHSVSQLRKVFKYCMLALLPLCFVQIASSLLGIMGYSLGLSLNRYIFVFTFGYSYYLAKILVLGTRNKKDMFCFFTFALATVVSLWKPLIFTIACLTFFITAISFVKLKGKRLKIISLLLLFAIVLCMAFVGFNKLTDGSSLRYYERLIVTRYLKAYVRTGEGQNEEGILQGAFYVGDRADLSGGRLLLWEKSWDLFKENIFMGKGLGLYAEYDGREVMLHNIYLYFLACGGILGASLIFGLIFQCIRIFLKGLRISGNLDLKIGLLGFIFGTMCFNLVGSFITFYGYMFMFSISFGALLKLSMLDIDRAKKGYSGK